MPGIGDAMAALMSQFGQGGGTVPGAMPSAYDVNKAAASVPGWSPAGAMGAGGGAPMASPLQSVPGLTAPQNPMMGALQNPASYGSGGGGGLAHQGANMALSAGATALLTPVLGPAAMVVGPAIGSAAGSLIPFKGGGAAVQAPQLHQQSAVPRQSIPDMGVSPSGDQYAMLLQMLQNGGRSL